MYIYILLQSLHMCTLSFSSECFVLSRLGRKLLCLVHMDFEINSSAVFLLYTNYKGSYPFDLRVRTFSEIQCDSCAR